MPTDLHGQGTSKTSIHLAFFSPPLGLHHNMLILNLLVLDSTDLTCLSQHILLRDRWMDSRLLDVMVD